MKTKGKFLKADRSKCGILQRIWRLPCIQLFSHQKTKYAKTVKQHCEMPKRQYINSHLYSFKYPIGIKAKIKTFLDERKMFPDEKKNPQQSALQEIQG